MEKLYPEDVYIKYNAERGEWDLILVENDEIVDSAPRMVTLINEHDCLK